MVQYGYTDLRNTPGGVVSAKRAGGIPALHRAARMRAEAIAGLRLRCWRGEGVDKTEVKQSWQAILFRQAAYNEYQTRYVFWDAVGESLAWRNNSYVWRSVDPMTGRVPVMYALHPDQVACIPDGYRVTVSEGYIDPVGQGRGVYEVEDDAILHIRGHGDGGMREAPSPIKVFAATMGAALNRLGYEASMWAKGAPLQLAVQFPEKMTHQKAEEWRQMWQQTYDGVDGARTAVIGGGADIKPIGMSMVDAQFAELAKLTVQDASRIMGVPANLIGAQLERSVPNLEQDLSMWMRFGLGPDLTRIETAVQADGYLFAPGSDQYPMFEADQFVRGDLLTEDAIAHAQVQDGRVLVNEWRKENGRPPIPGGDIPQIVPVGGGANPVPTPAATKPPQPVAAE
jgi:HK97 family phage portal protein